MHEPIRCGRLPAAAFKMSDTFGAQTERHESGRHSALAVSFRERNKQGAQRDHEDVQDRVNSQCVKGNDALATFLGPRSIGSRYYPTMQTIN
jgi:hypothetical protein